jgi:hypothetical protein
MTKEKTNNCIAIYWDVKEFYPLSSDELNAWQWRWEFLRRSAEYLQAWESGYYTDEELWRAPSSEYEEVSNNIFKLGLLLDPNEAPRCDVSIFTKQNGGFLFKQMRSDEQSKLIERFKLPPEKQGPYLLSLIKNQLRFSDLAWDGKLALAAFDLTLPIKKQIKRVEHLLESAQKMHQGRPPSPKLTGKARRLWPIYLRLIDAADQGVRPMEIFKQFEEEGIEEIQGAANEAGKISDMISAARKVQEKVIFYL